MTKEQAYEKLELPIDTDLQVVRQKFQQMHNDFQVQIDGSFSAEMRQLKEKQLEELKEAFAVLNESASMDDSASLPCTERTYEQCESQRSSSDTKQNTFTAQQSPPQQEKQHLREHTSLIDNTALEKKKSNTAAFIILVLIIISAGIYFVTRPSGTKSSALDIHAVRDSSAWNAAFGTSSEAAYARYIDQFPEGIFAQVANDSISQLKALTESMNRQVTKEADTHIVKQKEQTTNHPQEGLNQQTGVSKEKNLQSQSSNQTSTVNSLASSANHITDWRNQYDNVYPFKDGIYSVYLNDKQGMVDENGREIIPLYDHIPAVNGNEATIILNGKWGIFDIKEGREIIPPKYEHISSFREGLVAVKLNGKYGFIDRTGHLVIPAIYDKGNWFVNGVVKVYYKGELITIDKTGKQVK